VLVGRGLSGLEIPAKIRKQIKVKSIRKCLREIALPSAVSISKEIRVIKASFAIKEE
jgi:hypothetical protein